MSPVLLEQVARAADKRSRAAKAYHAADEAFRAALAAARELHTWWEIAGVAGISAQGVRYRVLALNERRKKAKEAA